MPYKRHYKASLVQDKRLWRTNGKRAPEVRSTTIGTADGLLEYGRLRMRLWYRKEASEVPTGA